MTESPFEATRYSSPRLFVIAVLFILAAPLFWLRTEMRQGAIASAYENADLYQDVYPNFHYGFGRVRAGEMPLWNSKQRCGAPFLANPATALFQPLNALFLVLPTEKAMAVQAFAALSLMGILFAGFVRSLGASYPSGFVGGVAYAFCGASVAAMSRPGLASALAWAPLLFWSVNEYARRFRRASAVLAGLAAALVALSGANALAVSVLCLGLAFAVFKALLPGVRERPSLMGRIGGVALMAAVALGVAAIQWVPALFWVWSREQPAEALWALNLPGQVPASARELLAQLLVSTPEALPRIAYLGVAPLVLVPAALFHRSMRRDALFFATAGALLFFVALGGAGRIALPFPQRYLLFPGMFCLSVLVSLGFNRLSLPRSVPHPAPVWVPALAVIAAAAGLFYVTGTGPRGRLIAALVVLVPVVLLRMRWASALAGLAFGVLVFADLAEANVNIYGHPFEDAPACYERHAKALRVAEEQALGARVLVSAQMRDFGMPANLGMLAPLIYCTGGRPPLSKDEAIWRQGLAPLEGSVPGDMLGLTPDAQRPNLLNFMAARAILATPQGPLREGAWRDEGPRLRETRVEDNVRVFVNEDALPRAYWVAAWRAADSVDTAARMLADPAFDGARECVIDRRSPGYGQLVTAVPGPHDPEAGPAPVPPPDVRCALEEPSAERVTVHVAAPQPGITVVADTLEPGWTARLDGMPCAILRANGIFRGVVTPAGEHTVVFEYRPLWFWAGVAVSLGMLALLTAAGLVALARH